MPIQKFLELSLQCVMTQNIKSTYGEAGVFFSDPFHIFGVDKVEHFKVTLQTGRDVY